MPVLLINAVKTPSNVKNEGWARLRAKRVHRSAGGAKAFPLPPSSETIHFKKGFLIFQQYQLTRP
jgi:hypothetical protein